MIVFLSDKIHSLLQEKHRGEYIELISIAT